MGCAATESALDARFNICNCDHTMIRATPIADELDLAAHGLRYVEPEPSYSHVFWDDALTPWLFFHDAERTLDGLGHTHPDQVDAYRRYLAAARPAAELVVEMACTAPSTPAMVRTLLERRAKGATQLLRWSRMSLVDALGAYFDDPAMILPLVSTGPTVWGVPPTMPGTGTAAMLYGVRHLVHTGRPEGGSGSLTDSIAASFTAAGGRVRTSSSVRRIVASGEAVRGVELDDGTELTAATVVAACDPRRALVDWLDEPPAGATSLVEQWRSAPTHDGYESKVDAVVRDLPDYLHAGRIAELEVPTDGLDLAGPTTVVSPSLDEIDEAHRLRDVGHVHLTDDARELPVGDGPHHAVRRRPSHHEPRGALHAVRPRGWLGRLGGTPPLARAVLDPRRAGLRRRHRTLPGDDAGRLRAGVRYATWLCAELSGFAGRRAARQAEGAEPLRDTRQRAVPHRRRHLPGRRDLGCVGPQRRPRHRPGPAEGRRLSQRVAAWASLGDARARPNRRCGTGVGSPSSESTP